MVICWQNGEEKIGMGDLSRETAVSINVVYKNRMFFCRSIYSISDPCINLPFSLSLCSPNLNTAWFINKAFHADYINTNIHTKYIHTHKALNTSHTHSSQTNSNATQAHKKHCYELQQRSSFSHWSTLLVYILKSPRRLQISP